MNYLRLKCYQCGSVMKSYERQAGKRSRCPSCKAPLRIPPTKFFELYSGRKVRAPKEAEWDPNRPGGPKPGATPAAMSPLGAARMSAMPTSATPAAPPTPTATPMAPAAMAATIPATAPAASMVKPAAAPSPAPAAAHYKPGVVAQPPSVERKAVPVPPPPVGTAPVAPASPPARPAINVPVPAAAPTPAKPPVPVPVVAMPQTSAPAPSGSTSAEVDDLDDFFDKLGPGEMLDRPAAKPAEPEVTPLSQAELEPIVFEDEEVLELDNSEGELVPGTQTQLNALLSDVDDEDDLELE